MLEKDIQELEFEIFQKEIEVFYYNKLEDTEKTRYLTISLIEKWGKKNTSFFKGKGEELIQADHKGNPQYDSYTWDYEDFEELPYEWQANLIKQYLVTLK